MLIILIPLVIFNLIPSLKLLAPFSLFANAITFIALFIIVYYMLSTKKSADIYTEPIDYWGSITTFPLFFGTILFALTSVPVVSTFNFDCTLTLKILAHYKSSTTRNYKRVHQNKCLRSDFLLFVFTSALFFYAVLLPTTGTL